jgi:Na+/melibiose symporter-like transporter
LNDKIEEPKGLKDKKKAYLFGMPRLGSSIVLGMEGWGLFTLYYVGYGIPAIFVAIVQALGYLTIGLAQFSFGWLSDAKYTRLGRRKPYIVVFTPLLGISYILLLLPSLVLPDLNDKVTLFFWLLIWDLLFKISYSLTTPYQAWMAEQFEVAERPKVSQIQNYFNYLGSGIQGIVTILILTSFISALEIDVNAPIPLDLLVPVLLFGIITIILFLLVAILMPTEPHFKIDTNLKEIFKVIVSNKNFMRVILMVGISSLAWSMISTMMLTYTEVVLDLGTTEYVIAVLVLFLGIFGFLQMWRKLIQKIGKKKSLLNVMLLGACLISISLIGLIPNGPYLIFGIIFMLIVAIVLAGWFIFPYIVYADSAEDDEKATGELKAGAYAGFPSIILNAFQAFGAMVLGVVIENLPNITVGSLTYSFGLIIWGPICSGILLIAYFYTKKYVTLDYEWEKE